jgi:hypothetical protein
MNDTDYKTSPEQRAYKKAYYAANKEKCRAGSRDWYSRNKTRANTKNRAWRKERPNFKKDQYAKDPEKFREAQRVFTKTSPRYLEKQRFIDALKDVPCKDCGRHFPPECMDFDHVRGEKVKEVSKLAKNNDREALMREIVKCDVVCACCHRIRTRQRLKRGPRHAI